MPFVYAPEGVASGSFPGVAMQRLEANLGEGTVAMFVQGCAANVSPGKYWPGQSLEAIETAGSLIADRGYSDGVISAVFHRNCLRRLQSILPEFAQLRSASVPNDNGFRRSTMRATATRDNVESIPALSGG